MSFFNKSKSSSPSVPEPSTPAAAPPRPQPSRPATPSGPTRTKIAKGSKVVGEITGNAELVIEGEVHGEITLESTVTIAPGGVVRGPIRAISVEVGGRVFGNVEGQEKVQILSTGGLEGNIQAPKIPIAEDGFCKGQLDPSKPPKIGGESKKNAAGNEADKKAAPKAGESDGAAKDKPAGAAKDKPAGGGKK